MIGLEGTTPAFPKRELRPRDVFGAVHAAFRGAAVRLRLFTHLRTREIRGGVCGVLHNGRHQLPGRRHRMAEHPAPRHTLL